MFYWVKVLGGDQWPPGVSALEDIQILGCKPDSSWWERLSLPNVPDNQVAWLYGDPEPWVGTSVGRVFFLPGRGSKETENTQEVPRNNMCAEGPRRWSWYRTLTSNQPGLSQAHLPSATPGPLVISRLHLPHLRKGAILSLQKQEGTE